MSEYSSLLSDLSDNITNEDLEQLKSACKEDIPEEQSNSITSSRDWFSYLEKNDKLAQGERNIKNILGINWTKLLCPNQKWQVANYKVSMSLPVVLS